MRVGIREQRALSREAVQIGGTNPILLGYAQSFLHSSHGVEAKLIGNDEKQIRFLLGGNEADEEEAQGGNQSHGNVLGGMHP